MSNPVSGHHGAPRPLGVTALSMLFAFGTLASGLSGVSLLSPGGALEPMWRLNPRAREAFATMGRLGAASPRHSVRGVRRLCLWLFSRQALGLPARNHLAAGQPDRRSLDAALGVEPRAFIGVPVVALLLWYLSSAKVRDYFGAPLTIGARVG